MDRSRLRPQALLCVLVLGCSDPAEPPADDDGSTSATTTTSSSEPATGSSSAASEASTTAALDDSSGEPPPMIDCTEACADPGTDAGAARCYSCRCLQAMDGWLPSPQELQCSQAEEIVLYRADLSDPTPALVPTEEESPADCANPSLLTWSCQAGSRLGRIDHDDVIVRWICRDPYDVDGQRRYADVGAIAYNARTGATCWWDDVDEVTGDDDFPNLDLDSGDQANLDRFLANFYYTEGDHCTECHDGDPFIYTPYLRSTQWTAGAYPLGPYALVRPDGSLDATAQTHLVDPEVAPCSQCHRIASAGTCEFLAPDSMGLLKEADTYEPAILDATEPGSAAWTLAYWMPGTTPANATPPPLDSIDDWLMAYQGARERIMECCAAPGVDAPGCTWAPIPAAP